MRLVRGVGINDADYKVNPGDRGSQKMCPYYKTWMNMLNRIYTPKKGDLSYNGCSVCDEWLRFSNFRNWMISQDHTGKALDKDLRVKGNKIYSPDTCCFISPRLNSAISRKSKTRDLPVGVDRTRHGRYTASTAIDGKLKYLGTFATIDEASSVHDSVSIEYIKRVARESDSKQVLEFVEIRFG